MIRWSHACYFRSGLSLEIGSFGRGREGAVYFYADSPPSTLHKKLNIKINIFVWLNAQRER